MSKGPSASAMELTSDQDDMTTIDDAILFCSRSDVAKKQETMFLNSTQEEVTDYLNSALELIAENEGSISSDNLTILNYLKDGLIGKKIFTDSVNLSNFSKPIEDRGINLYNKQIKIKYFCWIEKIRASIQDKLDPIMPSPGYESSFYGKGNEKIETDGLSLDEPINRELFGYPESVSFGIMDQQEGYSENSLYQSKYELISAEKKANDFNKELLQNIQENYEDIISKMSVDGNVVYDLAMRGGIKNSDEFKDMMRGDNSKMTFVRFVDDDRQTFTRFFRLSHLLVPYKQLVEFKKLDGSVSTREAFAFSGAMSISYLKTTAARIACSLLQDDDVSKWIDEYANISNVTPAIREMIRLRNERRNGTVQKITVVKRRQVTQTIRNMDVFESLAENEYGRDNLPEANFQQLESIVLSEIAIFESLCALSEKYLQNDETSRKKTKLKGFTMSFEDYKRFFECVASDLRWCGHRMKSILDVWSMMQPVDLPDCFNIGVSRDVAAAIQCAKHSLVQTSSTFKVIDDSEEISRTLVHHLAPPLWLPYAYLLHDDHFQSVSEIMSNLCGIESVTILLQLRELFLKYFPVRLLTNEQVKEVFLTIHRDDLGAIPETIALLKTNVIIRGVETSFENALCECALQHDVTELPNWVNKIEMPIKLFEIMSKFLLKVIGDRGEFSLFQVCKTSIDDSLHDNVNQVIKAATLQDTMITELILSISALLGENYGDIETILDKQSYLTKSLKKLFSHKNAIKDVHDIFVRITKPVFENFYLLGVDAKLFDDFTWMILTEYEKFKNGNKGERDTSYGSFRKTIGDVLKSGGVYSDFTKKILDDKYYLFDCNFFEIICAAEEVSDLFKVCFHSLSLFILCELNKPQLALQTSFIQNFNGTVVTQSATSHDNVLLCSRNEFLIPAASKTGKNINARFRVSESDVEFEGMKSDGVSSVSIAKLLRDSVIETPQVILNVDYTTDEISPLGLVSMGLPQDAAPSGERSVTVANPAYFYPSAPSCRMNHWAIFLPLTQETLRDIIERKSIKPERQTIERDIILSITSRLDLTTGEWEALINIINESMIILLDVIRVEMVRINEENEDKTAIKLDDKTIHWMKSLNSAGPSVGKRDILKMRVNDFFKHLNALFGEELLKKPNLTPIIKLFKYDMFSIIAKYTLNKNVTLEQFMQNVKLRSSTYPSRKKGGSASTIVDPFKINLSEQFDKSSELSDYGEESKISKKMERSDNFEETVEIETSPKIELGDEIKKIIESINAKTRSEIEMYAKMEKYKTLPFDKIKLKDGSELSVAKYGVYEMIDENGTSMIVPIKTEEQLAEVEERFKPLQSDTYIGGKGRRANRDAIKPKKTKKRASKTPLKRVTKNKKNKNKNKNNKSNKKNKKNHYNNRKKTRR